MTKLVLKELTTTSGEIVRDLLSWQILNAPVLALCPPRWDALTEGQKWVLIRILARREGYVPDWVSKDLWASLKSQLMWASFDDETAMLEMSRTGIRPDNATWDPIWADARDRNEIMSGKAPQSFREGP